VSTFHSSYDDYFDFQSRSFLTRIERWALDWSLRRNPGRGVAPSRDIANSFEARFPRMAPVRVLLPTAASPLGLSPDESKRDEHRSELGIPAGSLAILCVGSLGPRKNQLQLVDALARCVAGGVDGYLLLAGPEEEPAHSDVLRNASQRLGIADRVILLGLREDVGHLLGLCDVWALTSRAEGLPAAMLEAMATGKPVIVTPVGEICAAVQDGQNGLVVPVDDQEATVRAITQLACDEGLRQRLGQAAKATAERDFAPERKGREYAEIYEELVARSAVVG